MFWKTYLMILIPILLLPILYVVDPDPNQTRAMRMLYILCLMACYWMFQIFDLPITSLIPIVAFPLAEISDTKEVGSKYFNSTIFVFMAGIMIAIVVEETDLHKRIALLVLKVKFFRSTTLGLMMGKHKSEILRKI